MREHSCAFLHPVVIIWLGPRPVTIILPIALNESLTRCAVIPSMATTRVNWPLVLTYPHIKCRVPDKKCIANRKRLTACLEAGQSGVCSAKVVAVSVAHRLVGDTVAGVAHGCPGRRARRRRPGDDQHDEKGGVHHLRVSADQDEYRYPGGIFRCVRTSTRARCGHTTSTVPVGTAALDRNSYLLNGRTAGQDARAEELLPLYAA